MGGNATFSGTMFQARVIAYIYVHILAQIRLYWLAPEDDTPLAVSGETDGPGDDARLEFGSGAAPAEVQAKHGFKGGRNLYEVFERIHHRRVPGTGESVILVVDRESSSRFITTTFARDLDRMRSGRTDGLGQETLKILDGFNARGFNRSLLNTFRVIPLDVDQPRQSDSKVAMLLLREFISDLSQTDAAWAVLVNDAAEICARRLRRTHDDLRRLLTSAGIRLDGQGSTANGKDPRIDELADAMNALSGSIQTFTARQPKSPPTGAQVSTLQAVSVILSSAAQQLQQVANEQVAIRDEAVSLGLIRGRETEQTPDVGGFARKQEQIIKLIGRESDLELELQWLTQNRMYLANMVSGLYSALADDAKDAPAIIQRIREIQTIDKMLELQVGRINTQAEALRAELESVRRIIGRNIEQSFRLRD